eukprot:284819887_3
MMLAATICSRRFLRSLTVCRGSLLATISRTVSIPKMMSTVQYTGQGLSVYKNVLLSIAGTNGTQPPSTNRLLSDFFPLKRSAKQKDLEFVTQCLNRQTQTLQTYQCAALISNIIIMIIKQLLGSTTGLRLKVFSGASYFCQVTLLIVDCWVFHRSKNRNVKRKKSYFSVFCYIRYKFCRPRNTNQLSKPIRSPRAAVIEIGRQSIMSTFAPLRVIGSSGTSQRVLISKSPVTFSQYAHVYEQY